MVCADCGDSYELSARNTRLHQRNGTTPKCSRCRYGAKPPRVTEAMRRWWLDRYSLDEIGQMAGAMWPDFRQVGDPEVTL